MTSDVDGADRATLVWDEEPRAAYVHVPFCGHRCGYCNFTLVAGRDELVGPYLDALARELSALGRPRPVETLFFGGGTPSRLRGEELARLFDLAAAWFPTEPGAEVSLEANPVDLDEAQLAQLSARGVNRLSIGVQSFHAEKLRRLERDHSPELAQEAVARARRYVASLSLDLIFAAPGESLSDWEDDLARSIALGPDHISTYGLTFERGTTFWGRRLREELSSADEETERAMYLMAIERLTAAGYEHYEVSNFARPGHRCRHNEVYWSARPYYAAGPGAARYVGGRREVNHKSTTTWIKRVVGGQSPVAEIEQLTPEDRAREAFVLGMRRLSGVTRAAFRRATGHDLDALLGSDIGPLVRQGLLSDEGETLRLTREGLLVSDSLWPRFLRM